MDEALRQHYLNAMGIPVWYARCRLPGANASPSWDFSQFPAQQDEEAVKSPSVEQARRGLEQARRAMAPQGRPQALTPMAPPSPAGDSVAANTAAHSARPSVVSEARAERIVTAEPIPAEADQSGAVMQSVPEELDVPHFHIRVFRLPGAYGISLAHPETEAHREQVLLNNIVLGCWGSEAQAVPLFEFGWPVFSNERLRGQERAAARETLRQALLESEIGDSPIILFGLPPVWPQASPGSTLSMEEFGMSPRGRALCTWSLGEGLLDPQRKKDIWLHLRGFVITQ